MKKFFAMLVAAALLASLGALTVNAVDESEWNAFGEVKAEYVEDLSTQITLDGDVSDWQEAGFQKYEIDQYNLDAWVGEVDENWKIDMWFSADAEYLYVAFKIYDNDVQFSDDGQYNKDAFQIQLDFNGWAAGTEAFERAVFYSFGLQEDGTVDITVQCIYGDASSTTDYYMASDDDPELKDGDVKGATKKAEDGSGWYAEFAISWQTLYNDIATKLSEGGEEVPEWTGGEDKVSLNMLVCYLDHDTNEDGSDAGIKGAWGTSHALGSLGGGDGWYPESAGMTLTLEGSISIETTEEPTTEEPTETAPEDSEDDTTVPAEDDATTAPEAGDDQTTEAPEEEKSCNNIVALPVVALVAVLGVAFVAKKKD